jgi:hypothetical protein
VPPTPANRCRSEHAEAAVRVGADPGAAERAASSREPGLKLPQRLLLGHFLQFEFVGNFVSLWNCNLVFGVDL